MAEENRSIDQWPEDAQAYVKQLRTEAASYRTQRNEFEQKYAEAGTALAQANKRFEEMSALPDQVESLGKTNARLQESLDRAHAAWSQGLAPEDAPRLQGANKDEWAADAESLAKRLAGTKPPGVPQNPAAGEPPRANASVDPVTEAFRKAGLYQ